MTANTPAYKTKHLTFSYLIALLLIFLLFIVMYVLIQLTIKNQSADAHMINIAGRQSLLLKRISEETLLLWQSETLEMGEIHHESLSETMNIWTQAQAALVSGDEELDLFHENSGEILRLFDELEPHFQKLKTAINKILMQNVADYPSNPLSTVLIRDIVESSPLYLELMEKIVYRYEKEAVDRVNSLIKYENTLVFMLLALMALEVRYIFQPMVNRVQNSYRAFNQVNESLAREVAERKHSEQLMARFGRILDNSLNEIYIFNAETMRFVQVNQGALKNLGYTMDEMKHFTAMDIKPEVSEKEFYQIIAPLQTEKKEYILFDTKHQRKDGTLYPVEVRLQLSSMETPPVYVAIIQDVTERKRAEEEIKKKNRSIQLLQEVSSQANKSHSIEETLKFCVDQVCAFTSWPVGHVYMLSDDKQDTLKPTSIWYMEEEARFEVFHNVTMDTNFNKGVGLPGRVLDTGEPAWIFDVTLDSNFPRAQVAEDIGVKGAFAFPILLGDEVAAVLEFYSTKAMAPDEQLLKIMAQIGTQVGRVVERKQAEESIREKSKLLKHTNKELEEFNYVASHDLQEPLRTLTSYCTFLKKDIGENLSDRARQDISFITDAAKRMQALIQDLLELSRAGRWEPKMEAVDMNRCVKTVSKDLGTRISESGAAVKWDLLPTVTGDYSHISRVLQNLIGNALKFHKKNPPVVNVSAHRENGMWAITVADNGIGMEPQYLDQIFMPFKRLHGKGAFEGSGIGLSVCKKIIERHGGEISVKSEPSKGSRFKFTLKAWDNKPEMEEVS